MTDSDSEDDREPLVPGSGQLIHADNIIKWVKWIEFGYWLNILPWYFDLQWNLSIKTTQRWQEKWSL